MKAKNFYLLSETIRDNAIAAVNDALLDGKTKVTLSSAGGKKPRQRGLQWVWYKDVEEVGTESAKTISVASKIAFGLPIAMRNQEKYKDFLDLYWLAEEKHGANDDFMYYFFDKHFHTEDFDTNEMAQFLTAFEIHYTQLGVELSDPIDWKLLNK